MRRARHRAARGASRPSARGRTRPWWRRCGTRRACSAYLWSRRRWRSKKRVCGETGQEALAAIFRVGPRTIWTRAERLGEGRRGPRGRGGWGAGHTRTRTWRSDRGLGLGASEISRPRQTGGDMQGGVQGGKGRGARREVARPQGPRKAGRVQARQERPRV